MHPNGFDCGLKRYICKASSEYNKSEAAPILSGEFWFLFVIRNAFLSPCKLITPTGAVRCFLLLKCLVRRNVSLAAYFIPDFCILPRNDILAEAFFH